MNLEKLLAYQDEDRKIWELENQLRNGAEKKKIDENAKENKRAKEELTSKSRRTEDLFAMLTRLNNEAKTLAAELNDIVETVEDFEELREIDLYEKKINQITKLIEANEREIKALSRELNDIEGSYQLVLKKIVHSANEHKKYSLIYNEKKAELSVQAKQHMVNRNKHAEAIDKTVLAAYARIRANKMPVVVPLSNKSCFCGMELDMSALAKIDKDGYAECPNCSRIVYKK